MADAGSPLGELVVLDEVGSTNDEVMARAREGAPHGLAVRARRQTAGRGRRDHAWSSPAGGLYLSVLLRPRVPERLLSGLSVACGVGAARALRAAGAEAVRLKWPNDLVCGARKLGGILVETSRSADGPLAVCGLGVNLRTPVLERADAQALPPVGLEECLAAGSEPPDVDELAESVREEVLRAEEGWERALAAAGAGALPLTGLAEAYEELLAFRGERVEALAADGTCQGAGTLLGVDGWGRALLGCADGTVVPLDAALVSLRPAP